MYQADRGICSIHGRKRYMVDLMEIPEEPGKMKCKPQKECRITAPSDYSVCALHNKRRNIIQMREVRPGVYECLPRYMCKTGGEGGVPFAPYNAGPTPMLPPTTELEGSRYATAPSNFDMLPNTAIPMPMATEADVWCARHGRRLLKAACRQVDGSVFVCRDAAVCMSMPLDSPGVLKSKNCHELLCSVHCALRLVSFLELNENKDGYVCKQLHGCRGTTVPSLAAEKKEVSGPASAPFFS